MITYVKPKAKSKTAPPRRPPEQVIAEGLGVDVEDLPENAASPSGSTFYKRWRRCGREGRLDELGVADSTLIVHDSGLVEGRAEALDLGFIWHAALEQCWKEMKRQQDALVGEGVYDDPKALKVDWAACEQAAWQVLELFRAEEGYEETYPILETMLPAYFEKYRREGSRWRIVAVEITLEYREEEDEVSPEQIGPMIYTARLDLLVVKLDRNGVAQLWIVEHKTATRLDEILLDNYQLDLQIVGQVWLLNNCVDLSALPPFAGVIVDITTKPRNSGGKVDLHREDVCPSIWHQASHEQQVRMIRGELLPMYERTGYLPTFGNCAGPAQWFRRCAYYDVCQTHPMKTPEEILEVWNPRRDDDDE